MSCICSIFCQPPISAKLMEEIQESIGELIIPIPVAYAIERQGIVDGMRNASPEPHQGLFYVDYPEKNGTKVNDLARRIVASDEVKKQIADEVNTRLQGSIESQIADVNPCVRALMLSTIETTIEVAVNRAVDNIVFPDVDESKTTTSNQQE